MIQENIITNIKLQIELEEQINTAQKAGVDVDAHIIPHHRHALADAQRDGDAALVERHSAALKLLQAD
jgi:hypothetical protein